jgi:hypothetical protein
MEKNLAKKLDSSPTISFVPQSHPPYFWDVIDNDGVVRAVSRTEDDFAIRISVAKQIFVERYHQLFPEESFNEF